MEKQKNFWDKNAGRYERFMHKDAAAYEQLYELLRPVVRRKTVLELAAGTGLIAKNIVNSAAHIEAADASKEMITQAKRSNCSAKLHFSVQDMFHLPYADESFDVVIVANALHIVLEPEKALSEIRRVLKDNGVLVAPTFTHADNAFFEKVKPISKPFPIGRFVTYSGLPTTMRFRSPLRKSLRRSPTGMATTKRRIASGIFSSSSAIFLRRASMASPRWPMRSW